MCRGTPGAPFSLNTGRHRALCVPCIATLAFLVRLAGPSLLPSGSGPDLTHHLLLVDYVDRHQSLVHDPDAGRYLGEMAHYTPGLHLLSVIGGVASGVNGFFAVFPVVALSVALKFGFFALVLLRLFEDLPARLLAAAAGTALVFSLSPFTIQSFTHDSFLAQVVGGLLRGGHVVGIDGLGSSGVTLDHGGVWRRRCRSVSDLARLDRPARRRAPDPRRSAKRSSRR